VLDRDRDQLEVALPVLAHDTDVVVQPQPFVLDGERESSADDLEVELEGDTFIKASASTAEPDLGKEGSFPKSTDAEGLLGKVENDNEPDVHGTNTENHFVGLLGFRRVDIAVLDGEDVDSVSVFQIANAMMVTEPLLDVGMRILNETHYLD